MVLAFLAKLLSAPPASPEKIRVFEADPCPPSGYLYIPSRPSKVYYADLSHPDVTEFGVFAHKAFWYNTRLGMWFSCCPGDIRGLVFRPGDEDEPDWGMRGKKEFFRQITKSGYEGRRYCSPVEVRTTDGTEPVIKLRYDPKAVMSIYRWGNYLVYRKKRAKAGWYAVDLQCAIDAGTLNLDRITPDKAVKWAVTQKALWATLKPTVRADSRPLILLGVAFGNGVRNIRLYDSQPYDYFSH